MTLTLLHLAAALAAPTPDPGGGGVTNIAPVAPSFAGKFTLLISWTLWGCSALCVVGIAVVGTMLALSIRRGETAEHASRLGAAMAGVIIVGLASTIVNQLL
jgi:hypothetical protein